MHTPIKVRLKADSLQDYANIWTISDLNIDNSHTNIHLVTWTTAVRLDTSEHSRSSMSHPARDHLVVCPTSAA